MHSFVKIFIYQILVVHHQASHHKDFQKVPVKRSKEVYQGLLVEIVKAEGILFDYNFFIEGRSKKYRSDEKFEPKPQTSRGGYQYKTIVFF